MERKEGPANTASTCIISIVRLFTLRDSIDTDDPTWDNVPTSYWTVVELNCGIICACLPTLRPLLRKFLAGPDRDSSPKGSFATIGEQSLRKKPRGLYSLATVTEVEEGRAAESEEKSRVRTAAWGTRGRDEELGGGRIMVTGEAGVRESVVGRW